MFLVLISFEKSQAQVLSRESNSYLAGDWLDKIQVSFREDKVDSNYIWTIELLDESKSFVDRYIEEGDSLVNIRQGMRTYFLQKAQNIYLTGYETNQYKVHYSVPEVYLHFPFMSGNVLDGDFEGTGMYCDKLAFRQKGHYETNAEKQGCIVTEFGDTIHQVMLIHTYKKNRLLSLDDDKCLTTFCEDEFRWYASGCRYPVMYQKVLSFNGHAESFNGTADFYPHYEQSDAQLSRDLLEDNKVNPRCMPSFANFRYNASLVGSIISVVSKNGNIKIHNIDFSYDYFHEQSRGEGKSTALVGAADDNYSAKRLRLDGVVVDGKKYSFSYHDEVALPYVTSLSQDYWGYYNGIDNHNSFCSSPSYIGSGNSLRNVKSLGKANRLASPKNMLCGMLKRIAYPTGGYTDFEFESNHFDDAYYYPRAEHPICKTATIISVSSVAAQKEKPNGQSFTLTEDKDIEFSVNINSKDPQNHPCSATIWCAHGNNYLEVFSTTVSTPGMSSSFIRHLKAGVYVISVAVPYVAGDYTTTASINAITGYTYKIDSGSSDVSGSSIGGGVRIKSITNYDGKNPDYVGKILYEYKGGKLLVPTVRRKELVVHYSVNNSRNVNTIVYSFVGSQKSELALMSMGVPAVGYSVVVKKSIDKEGNSNGYAEFDFENVPYQELGAGEQYYYPNYGLNGKIIKQSVYSSSDELVRKVQFTYRTKKYSEVLFPKCTPLFLPGTYFEGCQYQLSIYPKANVWNYLTMVQETNYVSGKAMRSKITNYVYRDENYKESQVLVQDGTGMQVRKDLFYPMDQKSQGAGKLLERNVLAEVTDMNDYQGKDKLLLTGGFHKDYVLLDNKNVVAYNFCTKGVGGVMHRDMNVIRHDGYGNILEYATSSGVHVTLLWSYSCQYPVMEIVGATYDEIVAIAPLVMYLGNKSSLTLQEICNIHSVIANKSKGHVTAYLYNPYYEVSDIIFPNGNIVHYDYDAYGRLVSEKDIENKPLSNYKYNYRQ